MIKKDVFEMENIRKRTVSDQLVSVRRSASGHLYADKVDNHNDNHNDNHYHNYNDNDNHNDIPQAEITKCDMVSTNGVAHQVCLHIK